MKLLSAMLGLFAVLANATAFADEPDPRTVAPSFTKACAMDDLDLIVALETVGNVTPTSPHLMPASDLLYSAREECYGGHEEKALQLYQAGVRMLSEQNTARAR